MFFHRTYIQFSKSMCQLMNYAIFVALLVWCYGFFYVGASTFLSFHVVASLLAW
jgi:hypothetical protein